MLFFDVFIYLFPFFFYLNYEFIHRIQRVFRVLRIELGCFILFSFFFFFLFLLLQFVFVGCLLFTCLSCGVKHTLKYYRPQKKMLSDSKLKSPAANDPKATQIDHEKVNAMKTLSEFNIQLTCFNSKFQYVDVHDKLWCC